MKKIFGAICITVFVATVVVLFCFYSVRSERSTESYAMDTIVNMKVSGRGSSECIEAINSLLNNLDNNVLSRHNAGSIISKLNADNGGNVDKEIEPFIETMLEIAERSGETYDFTMGEVSDLWGFGNNPEIPDESELKESVAKCGVDSVVLKDGTISFSGVLDFGSSGKGIALDLIKSKCLENSKINSAVISVGGSVLLYGDKNFRVGVADPNGNNGRYIAVLTLKDMCLSTSGNYERYFEQDGKRYHHILDPRTGYPVDNGLVSVTIVSDKGILTDILSTTCFVKGLGGGLRFAQEYNCEAVFVTDSKEIYVTDGLRDSIEITDSSYILR